MKRICLFIRLRVLRYFQDGYPEMETRWQLDVEMVSFKKVLRPNFHTHYINLYKVYMGLIVKRAPIPRGFPPPFFPMTFPSALWERQISSPFEMRKPEISQGWLRVPQRHSRLRYRWEQLDSSVTCRTGNSRQWGALNVNQSLWAYNLARCWWFRNLANSSVEVGSWNPTLYGSIFYIPGGWEWDFWTINSVKSIST